MTLLDAANLSAYKPQITSMNVETLNEIVWLKHPTNTDPNYISLRVQHGVSNTTSAKGSINFNGKDFSNAEWDIINSNWPGIDNSSKVSMQVAMNEFKTKFSYGNLTVSVGVISDQYTPGLFYCMILKSPRSYKELGIEDNFSLTLGMKISGEYPIPPILNESILERLEESKATALHIIYVLGALGLLGALTAIAVAVGIPTAGLGTAGLVSALILYFTSEE